MSNSDEPKNNLGENKKALLVSLSIQWSDNDQLNRSKYTLQTTLQTWASTLQNAANVRPTCEVLGTCKDGREVQVSIEPPPDFSELAALKGQTLTRKGRKMLTVTSVSWDGDDAQLLQDGVMKAPPLPPSELQHEGAPVKAEGCAGATAAVPMAANEYLELKADLLPALCWTYREGVRDIEKRNNCVMNVKVEFTKGEGGGDPQKALSELKALIQGVVGPPRGSVVPRGRPDPEELDTQTRIDKPEEDVQLAQSSLEQHEPRQSRKAAEVFSRGGGGFSAPADIQLKLPTHLSQPMVKVHIVDPLFSGGITIERSGWELISTSYAEDLFKVQKKFSVQFEADHGVGQGNVRIRVLRGGNAALDSHAVRALSHLYKRIVTSPFNTIQPGGATGFTGPDPPKRGRSKPLLNGQSGDGAVTKKATVEEEDTCPICLNAFTDKKQLRCRHEFCRGCLDMSVDSLGPCCPVCKQVFGRMVGDQPDGMMTSDIISTSLPGFPTSGTIVITYKIPSGVQTKKHPNPGKRFDGTRRRAFLPNNKEGKEVLQLLRKAFDQKLIFTVGQSRTTNTENQVTWNDIHHKTSRDGGPAGFGYPDPDYLRRVREELKAKGIE